MGLNFAVDSASSCDEKETICDGQIAKLSTDLSLLLPISLHDFNFSLH